MSERDRHKSTYYSGKKPYLTHNYRTMMKKKTQEEYYFHELHEDPMSELLRPYHHDPELPGFTGYEYMAPDWGWEWPPWTYPGPGPGGGGTGPYDDDDGLPPGEGCDRCEIAGPNTVECGNAWMGQVIPSQCAGFITFAVGADGEGMDTAVTDAGFIVVAVPEETDESSMIVCSSGGLHGATCCLTVTIECCCAEPVLSGPETTTKPGSVEWSVVPACPGAEVACTGECTDITVGINEAGDTITATLGASACGSFGVSLTDSCSWSVNSNKCRITNDGGWDAATATTDLCDKDDLGGCCDAECVPPVTICTGLVGKNCAYYDKCYNYGFFCSGVVGQCYGSPCRPPCAPDSDCNPPNKVCWADYDTMDWTCDGVFGGWC